MGGCKHTTKEQKGIVNQTISLDTVEVTNAVSESHWKRPVFEFVLQKKLKCKHTILSKQFDIEFAVEHYIDTITYVGRGDSVFVKLLIKEKQIQKQLDKILFVPGVGRYYYIDCTCNDVISYSTSFNAKNKNTL